MSFMIPKNPQILYAPMLSTFGGGSARGFGMMTPVAGGFSSISMVASAYGPDNNTATVTAPSNINAGDLLIIQENGPDVTSDLGGNIPSGFTRFAVSENSAVDQRLHYKLAIGNEGGTQYSGQTGSNNDMNIFVFRANTAIVSVSVAASDGTTDVDTNPTVSFGPTTTSASIALLGAGTRASNAISIQNQSPASGWTIYNNINASGTVNECEAFGWRFSSSAGSTTYGGGMTSSSDSRRTMTGAVLQLSLDAKVGDYVNTNSYTFDGSQSQGTDLSSGIQLDNVANFDWQFDMNGDQSYSNNQWMLCNGPYNIPFGVMVGYYNASGYFGIAVAADNVGGYGFNPLANVPSNTTTTIKLEFRLNASSGSITLYQNGVQKGSGSGYTARHMNWDYLYVGNGAGSGTQANPTWDTNTFKGTISNIIITMK